MTEKIINATPHPVYMLDANKRVVRMFPKSNGMIRVNEDVHKMRSIDGVSITHTKWSKTKDVPPYVKGTYYIVSQLVKSALPNRLDFLVPKGVLRDEAKNVIGCTSLDL